MDAFPPNLLDSARDYATQNPPQSPGETTPKSSTTHTTTTTATLAADDGNDDDDYECNRIPTPFPELPEPEPEPKLGLLSFVKQQMDEHELEMLQQREVERQLSADMWEEEGCLYNDNDYDYRYGYGDDDDDDDYRCAYGGGGGGGGADADAEGDEDDEVVVGYSYLPEDRGGRLPMTSTPLRRGGGGRNATAVKHGERLPETSIISLITDSDSTPAPVPAPEGDNDDNNDDDDGSDIIITYATPIRKPLPNRRPSSLLSPPYFSSTRLPSLCLSSPSYSPSTSPSSPDGDSDSDSDSDSSLAITNVTPIKRPPPPPSQHNSASSSSSSTRPPKKRRRYADHAYTEDFKTGPWGYKDRLLLARALQRGIDFIALGQSMRRDVDDVFEKFEKVVKAGFYRCKMRDRGTQTD